MNYLKYIGAGNVEIESYNYKIYPPIPVPDFGTTDKIVIYARDKRIFIAAVFPQGWALTLAIDRTLKGALLKINGYIVPENISIYVTKYGCVAAVYTEETNSWFVTYLETDGGTTVLSDEGFHNLFGERVL